MANQKRWGWRAAPAVVGELALATTVLGCTEPHENATTCSSLTLERPILVLESDRSSSSALGRIGTDGCLVETADVSLGVDPALSIARGRSFVCVRDEGTVLEIDPGTGSIKRVAMAFVDGEKPPNPHDVGVDDAGRLWVARYNLTSLGIVETDGGWGGSVNLGAFGGSDGVPDMEAVSVIGDRAYVAIEQLGEGSVPEAPGQIAVVRATPPHDILRTIELGARNPFGRLVPVLADPSGATVAIAAPGDFDAVDAADGIEIVALEAGTRELAIDETRLGGSAVEVVIASATEGYAIVAGPVPDINPTSVVQFDPRTHTVTRTLAGPASAYVHSGLALSGSYVVVGDRTYGAEAIRFFDRTTGMEAGSIAPKLLAPVSIVEAAP